jgi:hypothetical protein
MTLRIVGSAAAAVCAVAALAGPVQAIPYDEASSESTEPELDYEVTESDPGIVCGSGEPVESAESLVSARADDESVGSTAFSLEESESVGSTAFSWEEGDACASGDFRPSCKKVTVKVKQRSLLFLVVAFEWTVEKTWCWSYPRLTSWAVYSYPTKMDRFMKYRGLVSRWDRYFTACCFSSTSGHSSYRMAEFENCVPIKGCIGSWYPRVRIDVGPGGYWRYYKDV